MTALEGTGLTADVTVTLRCNGAGCLTTYVPTAEASGSVQATRREAAAQGWAREGKDGDHCSRCAARAAAVTPLSLFDETGADAPMRLGRLVVDEAPADLEGRVPATATFSPCTVHGKGCRLDGCRPYRYDLTRVWNPDRPLACWIMMNPSTADAFQLDATLRRCKGFSELWGAGGILVLNMFALRSTDPKPLAAHPDPVGPDNDLVITHHFSAAAPHAIGPVILGWGPLTKLGAGARQMMADRAEHLVDLLRSRGARPQCLKRTSDGAPGHPLYISYDTAAFDYDMAAVVG